MDVRVTINGTVYSEQVLNGVTITYGKTTLFEDNRAPYCNVQLVQGDDPISLDINDPVVIEAQLTTSTWVPLFTGTISDVTTQLFADDFATTGFLAVGTLGKLAQGEAGAEGYPEQLDKERIEAILLEGLNYVILDGLSGTINDQPGTIDNWYDYDITVPGSDMFTLTAYDGGIANAFSLANQFVQETAANLIEDTDGTLRLEYYDYSYPTQISLAGETWLRDSLESFVNTQDLHNIVTLNADGYSATNTVSTSVGKFGARRTTFDTTIIDDDTTLNNFLLWLTTNQSSGDRRISQVTVDLEALKANSTSRYNNMLQLQYFQYLQVEDLPTVLTGSTEYDCLAAGWTWNISRNSAQITINLIERT